MIELDLPKPFQPSTKHIADFFANCGLVEEKDNAILLTLATLRKISAGVVSLSGSGKSVLTDILMLLLPRHRVYNLGLTSNTATMYDFEAVNNSDIIYVEELQKALNSSNPIMIELIKNITEGKDISRKVFDANTRLNKNYKIKGDLGIVFALALENRVKKDDELDRRVISLMTDISQDQNRKVLQYIGKSRFKRERLRTQTDKTAKELKDHVNVVLDLAKTRIENPFAEYIMKEVPVPFVKVRSHVKHYLNLIDASTTFYFKDRIKKDDFYFTNIQDVYTIHKLYGATMNRNIHNLPQLGRQIMDIFSNQEVKGWKKDQEKSQQTLFQEEDEGLDGKTYYDETKIHGFLKKRGILVKNIVVRTQCDELVESGFLGKELIGKKILYFKTDEVDEFEDRFDFGKCFLDGYKNMKEFYPEIAEEWLEKQMDNKGGVTLRDPITDEPLYLTDLEVKEVVKPIVKEPFKLKIEEETIEEDKDERI